MARRLGLGNMVGNGWVSEKAVGTSFDSGSEPSVILSILVNSNKSGNFVLE